ncbi:MAG: hypothetical protein HFI80_10760 [Lachnospiraceae bacterium]|jgi:hypothetical protein|uniref:hypothetical protein n=1 Tax=Hominisplanchenecus murintestinalis TaxID=2941517 RepID=UPI000EA11720|nr:hypothetical protein [Hominisplanchenecus murintestinalis]MCI9517467.1 hypothetical protein [Lachnospiraceae bacterium]RKJ93580.1 hypothetical protein D7Y41_14455 [Anaerotruncus sp. 1XD22-93]MCI9661997.1 hypothetical protein [Lachnospiraceae bacterium]NBH98180.1 hypothetical protein [Lachnospiraceae bacterium]NBI75242.1 hypothetical protein [Lachnospiraceae bacterium]
MTIIYDVIAKRHENCTRPDVVLFYDENKETAIKFMGDYDKKNGFTLYEKDGRFTIADIILRERYSTGEEISQKSYIEIYDECGRRRKEQAAG